jgi:hypothetical protein
MLIFVMAAKAAIHDMVGAPDVLQSGISINHIAVLLKLVVDGRLRAHDGKVGVVASSGW